MSIIVFCHRKLCDISAQDIWAPIGHLKTIESDMFAFDTIEKEVSTCENIFTSEHVVFGSDSVQMHRVSDTGFNANIDLRPRPRHLRNYWN